MGTVKFVVKEGGRLPARATEGSEGWDVYSPEKFLLMPGQRHLVKTGLFAVIPAGVFIDVRPRSGLALKHGVTVLNSPGTIDSDYTDEIGVILINHGQSPVEFHAGDRIAQFVFCCSSGIQVEQSEETVGEGRGGGFGSTGR